MHRDGEEGGKKVKVVLYMCVKIMIHSVRILHQVNLASRNSLIILTDLLVLNMARRVIKAGVRQEYDCRLFSSTVKDMNISPAENLPLPYQTST